MKKSNGRKKLLQPKTQADIVNLRKEDFRALVELKKALSPYWASRSRYQFN